MRNLLIVLLLIPTTAHAWFFFWIPGDLFSSKGDKCVSVTAKVGDRLRSPDGTYGVVKALSGPSERCTTATPIRAVIEMEGEKRESAFPSSG